MAERNYWWLFTHVFGIIVIGVALFVIYSSLAGPPAQQPEPSDRPGNATVQQNDTDTTLSNTTSNMSDQRATANTTKEYASCAQFCRNHSATAVNASCISVASCTDTVYTQGDGAPCTDLSVCCCRSQVTNTTDNATTSSNDTEDTVLVPSDNTTDTSSSSDCETYCTTNGFSGATDTSCVTVLQCSDTIRTADDGAPCDGTAVCCCTS